MIGLTPRSKKILIGTGIATGVGVIGYLIYKNRTSFGTEPPPAGMQEDYDAIGKALKKLLWAKMLHGYFDGFKWHKTTEAEENDLERNALVMGDAFEKKYGMKWGKAKDIYDLK